MHNYSPDKSHECISHFNSYDLRELASEVFSEDALEKLFERYYNQNLTSKLKSERLAKDLITKINGRVKCGVPDTELAQLSKLPGLTSKSKQITDVNIFNKEKTCIKTLLEVNSSPLVETVRKAVLGAADIIRFVRCGDSSISEFTAFVLPKP